jgi:hypothetical protein
MHIRLPAPLFVDFRLWVSELFRAEVCESLVNLPLVRKVSLFTSELEDWLRVAPRVDGEEGAGLGGKAPSTHVSSVT